MAGNKTVLFGAHLELTNTTIKAFLQTSFCILSFWNFISTFVKDKIWPFSFFLMRNHFFHKNIGNNDHYVKQGYNTAFYFQNLNIKLIKCESEIWLLKMLYKHLCHVSVGTHHQLLFAVASAACSMVHLLKCGLDIAYRYEIVVPLPLCPTLVWCHPYRWF